jgi:hypothetical protein
MTTRRNEIIPVLIGALALCATVRADMVPLSPTDVGYQTWSQTCVPADLLPPSPLNSCIDSGGVADLDPASVGFLFEPTQEAGQNRETKPAQILADRQNSFSLCLYALFGLGLCRSAPFVKKFHFGCIPDWYHTGGPAQIGHSFAIAPDCLSPAPVHCFIQPDSIAGTENALPQYCRGTVVSLWRKSQFTPAVLASRGPPSLS